MRRLTYKCPRGILVESSFEYNLLNGVCYQDCVDKLGSLEDIEEELGIDLPTLIKAQTQGFYIKDCLGISHVRLSEWRFNLIKKEVHMVQYNSHYYFKDYGKTWALTEKELEK